MKIRLYRGPFNGKVMEHPLAGRNEIGITGPKPMSRKQRHEWQWNQMRNHPYMVAAFPTIKAYYKICIGTGGFPLRHPDGSIFYEWDNPRG